MTLNKGPMANRSNLYVIVGMKDVAMKPTLYTICGYDYNTGKKYEYATLLKHPGCTSGCSYQLIRKVCDIVICDS